MRLTRSLAAAVATSALLATTAPAALASDRDTIRSGSCSGRSDWKLKVKPDNGRLEVEGEVDSNRNGQTWHWRILHDGSTSARGTRTTRAPSGSFEVERRVVDSRGRDTITWRASNARSGEVCRGSVTV